MTLPSEFFSIRNRPSVIPPTLRLGEVSGARNPSSLRSSNRTVLRYLVSFVLCLFAAAPAWAGTLTGAVRNGTTGTAVPHQDVTLIQLQGGMQPLETVQTNAQGRYRFERAEIGQGPMLVRAPYRGVNYHQNVPPGTATADIEIFEPTASASDLAVVNHAIIFQPQGGNLIVGEEFSVQNQSKPPATYFSDKGTFEFLIPEGAQLGQVSAAGPAGMPLPQSALDRRGKGHAIAFAFKPGKSLSNSSGKPPELNAPIQANLSTLFKPVSSDSLPPMESPAIARELLSFFTR